MLTVTCGGSSWCEAFAIPDKSAMTVAVVLFQQILCRYSCPDHLVWDQGVEFLNATLRALEDYVKVHHLHTTAYRPQCNGAGEAFNKVMKTALQVLSQQRSADWDEYLAPALLMYRTSVHTRTGIKPFVACYKEEPRLPVDLLLMPN